MWKFLAGALVMFLYYNQANARRGYYIVIHEWNRIAAENTSNLKPLGKAPKPLKTHVEVVEPTLETMESLGFKVKYGEQY